MKQSGVRLLKQLPLWIIWFLAVLIILSIVLTIFPPNYEQDKDDIDIPKENALSKEAVITPIQIEYAISKSKESHHLYLYYKQSEFYNTTLSESEYERLKAYQKIQPKYSIRTYLINNKEIVIPRKFSEYVPKYKHIDNAIEWIRDMQYNKSIYDKIENAQTKQEKKKHIETLEETSPSPFQRIKLPIDMYQERKKSKSYFL